MTFASHADLIERRVADLEAALRRMAGYVDHWDDDRVCNLPVTDVSIRRARALIERALATFPVDRQLSRYALAAE